MPKQEFYGFNPPTENEWIERIHKDLKGKEFNDFLNHSLNGNIELNSNNYPSNERDYSTSIGEFPLTRGSKRLNNNYRLEQSFDASDEVKSNALILESLVNGSSSVSLVNTSENTNYSKLLKDVETNFISVGLKSVNSKAQIAHFLDQVLNQSFYPTIPIRQTILWTFQITLN